ncbi:wall-associated receptor kinase 2-like [Humulus lupulus]|uniref:wall-associated receptor kinase 2-like n=1 Tax=Humulus lupulus TaxID=3486 RepID=UPI002B40B142|nr:wall-associated receptor kinase 2-like [Humulus lupulus]
MGVNKCFYFCCLSLLMLCPWNSISPSRTTTMAAKTTGHVVKASNCNRRCGDVEVPYPFGIDDENCAMNKHFLLKCNHSDIDSPQKLTYRTKMEVSHIDVENATMSVIMPSSFDCYGENGSLIDKVRYRIKLTRPFTFSESENKLIAFGCDTLAYMTDFNQSFGSGCISICSENVNMSVETSCSGVGCCQTSVPKHLKNLIISIGSTNNHLNVTSFNPCGYAFLADQRRFHISEMHLDFQPKQVKNHSVLLDWVVGNETCDKAKSNPSSYLCGENTDCLYSENGRGYRCKCSNGFKGNPFLKQGCEDIDECLEPEKYKCRGCKNTHGSYKCKCPLGMQGNGKDGNCEGFRITSIASVIGASIFLVIIAILLFHDNNRRKREKIFKQNGGLVLKHQRVRIFSKAELAKATNNYSQSNFIGQGGFASVYKGVVLNETSSTATTTQQIAVKKPKLDKDDQNKSIQINHQQFHEEIAIVSQVNHKNVVKLLGLCLETKIPLLVYELVPNGTLSQHIHAKRSSSSPSSSSAMLRPWKTRLRIATETALSIDYLHSLAQPPIIHRDIKSTNILLDENYTAKVSDFGASVLIPPGQTGIATTVQGTLGYLDPEYLTTGTLTTKSDVYSFGVVLVELITGEKPISNGVRSGGKSNIIHYFVSTIRDQNKGEKYVRKIVDPNVVYDEDHEREIETVAELAMKCLEGHGERRPSMKEVAEELVGLNKLKGNNNKQYYKPQQNNEETYQLLVVDHDDDQSSFSIRDENIKNDQVVEYTTFDVSGYDVTSSISLN